MPERIQFVPNSMLVRPAGSASQPTGRPAELVICALAQTSSGILTSNEVTVKGQAAGVQVDHRLQARQCPRLRRIDDSHARRVPAASGRFCAGPRQVVSIKGWCVGPDPPDRLAQA